MVTVNIQGDRLVFLLTFFSEEKKMKIRQKRAFPDVTVWGLI